jgi:serine/threonine protein kinase
MAVVPWSRKLLPLLFLFLSPVWATLEQGAILQEVKDSGWITIGRPSWTKGTDPCVEVWEGIECLNGNVVELNLTHSGLSGEVPPAVGRLTTLTRLDMGNNKACTNCTKWNKVTGDIAPIGNLVNLKMLGLTSNEMGISTFPKAIYKLKNLVELRVDNTQIGGPFPAGLSNLPNLQILYLGNNSFTGSIPRNMWKTMINLKELTFWGNKLTGTIPPEMGLLVNLTYLNMNKNSLYGGLPPELGSLVKLERALLYKNLFTGPIPDSWKAMVSLTRFEFNANYLYGKLPSWLLQLPKLYFVQISNNQMYGSILPAVLDSNSTPALKNVSFECNYLGGQRPTVARNIVAYLEYNCFDGEPYLDSACIRETNCLNFKLYYTNGLKCPPCPKGQDLFNLTTCVCLAKENQSSKGFSVGAIVGVAVGAALLLLLLCLFVFCWRRSRRQMKEQPVFFPPTDYFHTGGSQTKFSSMYSWEAPGGVQHFTLEELKKATNGFGKANEIGEGGFGKVFVGTFPDGRTMAIKQAGAVQSDQGQFRNEVLLLSRLHHKNLVKLEGFCDDEGQQILVYEYMRMGNLHNHLHGMHGNRPGKFVILDWYKRLEIAVNVAQGLDYLHTFADPPVIHRDVKPTNILLDENLVAKVGDFGISKESHELDTHVSTRPAGTAGYFDPQYFLRRQLTPASDVYSFGVVLLEIISGRKAIEFDCPEEESNIIEWTKERLEPEKGGIEAIADPNLNGDYPREVFVTLVELALKCASFKRNTRPTMKFVVGVLEPLLQEAEKPSGRVLALWPSETPLLNSGRTRTRSTTSSFQSTMGSDHSLTNQGLTNQGIHRSLDSVTRIEMDTVLLPR